MADKSIIKKYSDVIIVFLVSRVIFSAFIILSGLPYSDILNLFDCENYNWIARYGYARQTVTAFFPMIPIIIHFLGDYGAVAVNQVCLFFSMVILKKLLHDEFKCPNDRLIMTIFAFSPVSYFSLVVYTESIFFFLTLSSYYLFVKNKYPLLMGLLIGLSVFTRNTGSIVFFAIFAGMVIRLWKKKTKMRDIFLAYIPATLISLIYPVYLQITYNNWKLFVDCQFENWLRFRSNVFTTYYESFKMLFLNEYNYDIYSLTLFRANEFLTIVITFFLIFLCIKEVKKLKKISLPSVIAVLVSIMSIIIFSTTIVDPSVNSPTRSFYRYYLGMFPYFTLLIDLDKRFLNILAVLSAFSGCMISFIFFSGSFFY